MLVWALLTLLGPSWNHIFFEAPLRLPTSNAADASRVDFGFNVKHPDLLDPARVFDEPNPILNWLQSWLHPDEMYLAAAVRIRPGCTPAFPQKRTTFSCSRVLVSPWLQPPVLQQRLCYGQRGHQSVQRNTVMQKCTEGPESFADCDMQAPEAAPTNKEKSSVKYRLVVVIVSTLAVFVMFLATFPFLFILSFTLLGPIALGDTEDGVGGTEDTRGFFHRVHDVFLVMYWYVLADDSMQEGFYDDPRKFTDALLRTGVFDYPRLLPPGTSLNQKRLVIDDYVREFIGPMEPPRIVTPVKAVLSVVQYS